MSTISSDRLREIVDGFTGLEVCALSDRLGPEETLAIATELLSLRESHPIEDGEGWVRKIDVDELAGEIRYVDPEHKLGAGALAEALMPFLRER